MIWPPGFTISPFAVGIGISLFVFWLGFAIAVGIAANARGRSGAGWFALALLISPLLGEIILLALPSRAPPILEVQVIKFEAEGVVSGVPYRHRQDGRVEALLPGGIAVLQNMGQLIAATNGGSVEYQPARSDDVEDETQQFSDVINGFRYRVEKNGEVLALSPDGHEMKFGNWKGFWAAAHGEAQHQP